MRPKARHIWLVQSFVTHAVYDCALSLPEAKERALPHVGPAGELKWIVLDSGQVNGFSPSLERVVVVLVPCTTSPITTLEGVVEPGMKRYHALELGRDMSSRQSNGAPWYPGRMTSYGTLMEVMLDDTWTADRAVERRVIFKTQDDGSLCPFRLMVPVGQVGQSSWYELDPDDPESGSPYGLGLSDEEHAFIHEHSKRYPARGKQTWFVCGMQGPMYGVVYGPYTSQSEAETRRGCLCEEDRLHFEVVSTVWAG